MKQRLVAFFAGRAPLYILLCLSLMVGVFGAALTLSPVARREAEGLTAAEVYDKVLPSCVSVLAYPKDSEKHTESGSGFFISDDGVLATAYHVIRGADRVSIRTSDKKTHEVVAVLGYDVALDVAILKIDLEDTKPVEAARGTGKVGDTIYAVGRYLGADFTFTSSIIAGVEDRFASRPGRVMLRYCNLAQIGNSGGPVFDEHGRLLAMCQLQETSVDGSLQWGLIASLVYSVPQDKNMTVRELSAAQ